MFFTSVKTDVQGPPWLRRAHRKALIHRAERPWAEFAGTRLSGAPRLR